MTEARALLEVDDLSVQAGGARILKGVSIAVRRGEVLALIGASGSGKTTLALSALGRFRPGLAATGGSVRFDGVDLLTLPPKQVEALRGRRVAYVAQSAAAAFNPRLRLLPQTGESARLHGMARAEADDRARQLYRYLSLPDPDAIGRRFPFQVSGGQLQRFMIAMGLHDRPDLLVCDEPTSALDVTTQVEVMQLLKRAIADYRMAAIFVSHDLALVAQIADRIAVMRHGEIVEIGETEQILAAPRHPYTVSLMAARRQFSPAASVAPAARRDAPQDGKEAGAGNASPARPPRLAVRNLSMAYGSGPRVLHDIDLEVEAGEVCAVIGESGSGKSTLAQIIAGIRPQSEGSVALDGRVLAPLSSQRSPEDRRNAQLVFQMADTALNPAQSIGRILGRVLKTFHGLRGAAARARARELLDMVQLGDGYLDRRPSQMSGGEKQRANLARALAADPRVLICDEITSALDTIIAEAIVELVDRLRRELDLAVIFISHDLATVASIADRVTVLRGGRIAESGAARRIFQAPGSDYTRLLISSIPELRRGWLEEAVETRNRLAAADAPEPARTT